MKWQKENQLLLIQHKLKMEELFVLEKTEQLKQILVRT